MVEEYLKHEYKEDIRNIFGAKLDQWNGQYSVPYNSDLWKDICFKNQNMAQEDPDRHFALSAMFLFHFVTYMTLWDECIYNHTIGNSDICRFYEITGWPQIDLTYWKEFTREDREREFLPEDVNKILDRFGLLHNGVSSRLSQFTMSCIFATMQGMLSESMQTWNVSEEAKAGVSTRIQFLLDRVRGILKAGYKPNGPKSEQGNNDDSLDSGMSVESYANMMADEMDVL